MAKAKQQMTKKKLVPVALPKSKKAEQEKSLVKWNKETDGDSIHGTLVEVSEFVNRNGDDTTLVKVSLLSPYKEFKPGTEVRFFAPSMLRRLLRTLPKKYDGEILLKYNGKDDSGHNFDLSAEA